VLRSNPRRIVPRWTHEIRPGIAPACTIFCAGPAQFVQLPASEAHRRDSAIRRRCCRPRDSRYRGASLELVGQCSCNAHVVFGHDPEVRRWRSTPTASMTACSHSCCWVGTMVSALEVVRLGCDRAIARERPDIRPRGARQIRRPDGRRTGQSRAAVSGPVRDKPVSGAAMDLHVINRLASR
jgi:hypothetical protein